MQKGGNPGQPAIALAIVRSAHNYYSEKKVHEVNFKTNAVRPRLLREVYPEFSRRARNDTK